MRIFDAFWRHDTRSLHDINHALLLLLIMEALGTLIRNADNWQILQGLGFYSIPHHATLYTDDLILFIRSCVEDLHVMKHIFEIFHGASGLGWNLA
jgi:hypothetical protein